ncbi:ERCC4 domain-containing protein [Pseudoalteromonas sp. R3]|uniref:ERCC4 domain-containing protein n=1 Tax=Pseudoalteromonas sp. R3 TaxID=1709477 RepID=UPI0006B66FF4|nr:ERCC4 domain-containing protein [Pseudoalteromonas sp. R3]AZZ99340.1 multidrug MFS transporter [Pseudoalteromonas sp. R3]
MNIVADDREQASGITQLLSTCQSVNLIRQRLTVGDYLIDDWLIIERKQLRDLLISIIDGRLFSQAQRLSDSGFQPLLIIEGNAADIRNCTMDRRAVLGALASIGLIYAITTLRTHNQQETVKLMQFAAQQQRRLNSDVLQRKGFRPKTYMRKQLYLLQGLPNVGPKLAKRLPHHFGSIEAVFNATQSQLMAVDGIGADTAKAIRTILTTPSL